MLLVPLVRESPYTAQEKALTLDFDKAGLAASKSSHPCEKLVRVRKQASRNFETSKIILDYAKSLLVKFSELMKSLAPDTQPLTSYLAENRQFLERLHVRKNVDNDILIEGLRDSTTRLESQIHMARPYAAKASVLAFLLEQVDTTMVGCIDIQTPIAQEAKELMTITQSEFATLFT